MKKSGIFLFLFLFTFSILFFGESKKEVKKDVSKAKTAKVVKNEPVAKIGSNVITVGDVEKELSKIPPQFASYFNSPKRKRQYVQNLVDREVFSKEAEEKGYLNKPEIKKRIEDFKKRLLWAEYIRDISRQDFSKNITDEDLKKFYNEHIKDYTEPEKVHAKHILVKTKEEAEKVLQELKKGTSWDEVCKKYSIDKSNASKGGDLGTFSRGRMVKPFEDVVFSMKVGEISKPVKTKYGYHIIKLISKTPSKVKPFEMVKNVVKNRYINEMRKNMIEKERNRLYAKYGAVIYDKNINNIEVGTGFKGKNPPKILFRRPQRKK